MKIWLDAHLAPVIASWPSEEFDVEAVPVRDIGLRDAKDPAIFEAARSAGLVVMTKDSDFVDLVERRDTPPQVIWITCGNTSIWGTSCRSDGDVSERSHAPRAR